MVPHITDHSQLLITLFDTFLLSDHSQMPVQAERCDKLKVAFCDFANVTKEADP
jgi:hypothetical protein